MATRQDALLAVLIDQLARLGRSGANVRLGSDQAVTIVDRDGSWAGSFPVAFAALSSCASDEGLGQRFWNLFPRGG